MRETNSWKTGSFIVDSPAYQIPIPNTRRKKQTEETGIEASKGEWVLTNTIELSPDRAEKLFGFLTAEEDVLKQIADDENREAREALGKVYGLLAEYGRKRREMKKKWATRGTVKKESNPDCSTKRKIFHYSSSRRDL